MEKQLKIKISIFTAILILLSMFFAVKFLPYNDFIGKANTNYKKAKKDLPHVVIKEIHDTIIQPSKVIYLAGKSTTFTVYKIDSVNYEKHFTATLDSIVNSDTISISYSYPRDLFELEIKRRPDTTFIKTIEYLQQDTIYIEPTFWEKLGYIAVGLGAGSLIGVLAR